MHTELLKIIEATEIGDETYLVGWKGDPYSAKSFGNRFKKWCKKAGLPDNCAIDGLRKAATGRQTKIGCTTHQIMAITGHRTMKEVERYTEEYRRLEAAFEAFEMWENAA